MGGGEGGGALAEGVGVDGVGFEEEVEDLGGFVPGLALEEFLTYSPATSMRVTHRCWFAKRLIVHHITID